MKKIIWLVIGGILTVQAVTGVVIYYSLSRWSDRAAFGDMFGLTASLFSGLALAGVIYAIWLQKEELGLQRKELELTRVELEKSAAAQEKSSVMLWKQLDFMRKKHKAEIKQRQAETLPHFELVENSYSGSRLTLGLQNHGALIEDLSIDTEPDSLQESVGRHFGVLPNCQIAFKTPPELLKPESEIRLEVTFTPNPSLSGSGLLASASISEPTAFFFHLSFLDIDGNRRRVRIEYQPPRKITTTEVPVQS